LDSTLDAISAGLISEKLSRPITSMADARRMVNILRLNRKICNAVRTAGKRTSEPVMSNYRLSLLIGFLRRALLRIAIHLWNPSFLEAD
jgi:hypothetical protein